jgi:hypothetical protein
MINYKNITDIVLGFRRLILSKNNEGLTAYIIQNRVPKRIHFGVHR